MIDPLDHFTDEFRKMDEERKKQSLATHAQLKNDPYGQGRHAWSELHQDLGCNPYKVMSAEWLVWRSGWFAAR